MAITGGIKFFNKSQNLLVDGATIESLVSGDASADSAIDRNSNSYMRSVASDDTTTEIYEITFSENKTIDRILLLDHNWKEYTIKYDLSAVFTDFTTVVGIDGSLGGGIAETVFVDGTSYYEFASVTTGKIRIEVVKTQTTDAEKFISQIICTDEIGTFVGYPDFRAKFDRNAKETRMLSGRYLIQKSEGGSVYTMNFKRYPQGDEFNVDFDLVNTLFERENDFIIWPSGGRRGSTFFRYQLRGFRLKDAPTVQVSRQINPRYDKNVYVNPLNLKLNLKEVV